MKQVSILGCTGSIGTQSLDVCEKAGYSVHTLCAHKNITITGNRFVNMKDTAIFMNAVDGVDIHDNVFINCCFNNDGRPEDLQYVNIFKNCKNVNYGDNTVIDCAVPEKNI